MVLSFCLVICSFSLLRSLLNVYHYAPIFSCFFQISVNLIYFQMHCGLPSASIFLLFFCTVLSSSNNHNNNNTKFIYNTMKFEGTEALDGARLGQVK